jgi:hypothetical protein
MNKMDKRDELKSILDEALQEFPDIQLPPAFTDMLLSKLKNRLAWRELFAEFGLKLGLVIGALAILAAVLFFPDKDSEVSIFNYLVQNWQIMTALAAIFLFTFFFDQVFLRFLFRRNRS